MVRYPVSVVDHKETIKDPLQDDVNALNEFKNEQETTIPDNVIKGVKEIENFLKNTSDATTLVAMLESLISNYYTKSQTDEAITQNVAQVLNTFEVDEESGDITIEYDDGQTENNNE